MSETKDKLVRMNIVKEALDSCNEKITTTDAKTAGNKKAIDELKGDLVVSRNDIYDTLDEKTKTLTLNMILGYYDSNGNINYLNEYSHSEHMMCRKGDKITITNQNSVGGSSAAVAIAFFDKNHLFVECSTMANSEYIINNDNIYYFSVCNNTNTQPNVNITKKDNRIDGLEAKNISIENNLDILEKNVSRGMGDIVESIGDRLETIYDISGSYLNNDKYIGELSDKNFMVGVYSVSKNVKYRIIGTGQLRGDFPIAGFSDTLYHSYGNYIDSILLNGSSTPTDYDFSITPSVDGYIYIAHVVGTRDILPVYVINEEYKINRDVNELKEICKPFINKNIVVFGDSIMMLQRSNPITTNGAIDQDKLDAQDWDTLKEKLMCEELHNLGLGGATIMEKQSVTQYPQPDDNTTNCLPNEVRWLNRLVSENKASIPDAIVIWLGTNGAGEPTTDNFDEIMSLDWSVLSDDVQGASYRQSFYGGLRYSIESLYRSYMYATIIVVSPIQTEPNNYRTYAKLSTTRDALKKMSDRYSCLFIDALTEIGIVDLFETTTGDRFLSDGLHPNEKGKVLYRNYISKRLQNLYFSKSS